MGHALETPEDFRRAEPPPVGLQAARGWAELSSRVSVQLSKAMACDLLLEVSTSIV